LLELTGSSTVPVVTKEMEALERLIDKLSAEVRRAVTSGDRDRASGLRAELRDARRRWDESLDELASQADEPAQEAGVLAPSVRSEALLPAREQVHQALALLGAPAAPRLIVAVHDAFSAGGLVSARLTSLRRDEERSFRSAPCARPYYLCAALSADLLAPVRGLLAISTWSMDRRIIGPLSPRVDYLTAAVRIGERIRDLSDASAESRRLLWRFAANIPHAASSFSTMNTGEIVTAARAELAVHEQADSSQRMAAAGRARSQLDDAEQLFGAGLQVSRRRGAGA
jgi:hypothetical protein